MDCTVRGMCRGDGRAYIKFELANMPQTARCIGKAHLDNGNAIPCCIFPLQATQGNGRTATHGNYVAMIPLIDASRFTIDVECLDVQDVVLDTASFSVTSQALKWKSRYTYARNQALAQEIRDIDTNVYERVTAAYARCIHRDHGITAHLHYAVPLEHDTEVEYQFLDAQGNPVAIDTVKLGSANITPKAHPGHLYHETTISAALPPENPTLCLWVRDPKGKLQDGFLFMEAGFTRFLADTFASDTRTAEEDGAYDAWFRQRRISTADAIAQAQHSFNDEPLISIIVPVFNTPIDFFTAMVESVCAQTYSNWELVLVNASPENKELAQAIESFNDSRICAIQPQGDGSIVANTNAGIKAAQGEFVGFLDHDDVLEPDCLYEYVAAINANPETDLLYCDEDLLIDGTRFATPRFKPDFNRDLLYTHNYITHFLVVRASVIEQVGLSPATANGAQDYDLTLRAIEVSCHIHHVSKVLYHWRVHDQSTSTNVESKTYAADAGRAALTDHFNRRGIAIERIEDGPAAFTYKPVYQLATAPRISIVIPNKDAIDLLQPCIDSIVEQTSYPDFEIIVVENNSTDPDTFSYYEHVQADPHVRVVTFDGPFNFSKVVNYGASEATGELLLLLNNDTRVITPNFLETMAGYFARPEVGIVGAKLLHEDGTIQHAGVTVRRLRHPEHLFNLLPDEKPGYACRAWLAQNVLAVTGACQMIRRSLYSKIGGYDEAYTVGMNDIDFCLRVVEEGFSVVYCPYAKLYHKEFASREHDLLPERQMRAELEYLRFHTRWTDYFLYGDPFYNSNFDEGDVLFSLAANS